MKARSHRQRLGLGWLGSKCRGAPGWRAPQFSTLPLRSRLGPRSAAAAWPAVGTGCGGGRARPARMLSQSAWAAAEVAGKPERGRRSATASGSSIRRWPASCRQRRGGRRCCQLEASSAVRRAPQLPLQRHAPHACLPALTSAPCRRPMTMAAWRALTRWMMVPPERCSTATTAQQERGASGGVLNRRLACRRLQASALHGSPGGCAVAQLCPHLCRPRPRPCAAARRRWPERRRRGAGL